MTSRDAKLDELIDKAQFTMDQEERRKLFIEMQRIICENQYVIPLFAVRGYAVWQPYVHNYVYNQGTVTYLMNWSTMWLDVRSDAQALTRHRQ